MKGVAPLFLGIFGTFAFSWAGLALIPSIQIGHLDPQMDEEGNDAYPAPQSGLVERGRRVYTANGCVYCHTQQVRPDYASSDIERKWGQRRSAPRDYLFERPVLLGRMRMGPDLSNVGKRAPSDDANAPAPDSTNSTAAGAPAPAPAAGAVPGAPTPAAVAVPAPQPPSGAPLTPGSASAEPAPAAPAPAAGLPPGPVGAPSPAPAVAAQTADTAVASATTGAANNAPLQYSAAWHHRHLYQPRSVNPWSTMPSFRFLYEKRRITGEPAADALKLGGPNAAQDGWEIVPTYDAQALVAYLMSRDQSHELKEVKSATAVSPPAPGKAVK